MQEENSTNNKNKIILEHLNMTQPVDMCRKDIMKLTLANSERIEEKEIWNVINDYCTKDENRKGETTEEYKNRHYNCITANALYHLSNVITRSGF